MEDRPTSTPPAAKTINAIGPVATIVLGWATEAMIILCSFYGFLFTEKLDFQQLMMLLGLVSIGPIVGRAKGNAPTPSPTTAVAISAAASGLAKIKGLMLLPLVLAFALVQPACGLFSDVVKVTWPPVVECAQGAGDDVIVDVATVLQRESNPDTVIAKLEDIALVSGADIVKCAVQRLVADWSAPGAAQSPERSKALKNGQDFLAYTGEHP